MHPLQFPHPGPAILTGPCFGACPTMFARVRFGSLADIETRSKRGLLCPESGRKRLVSRMSAKCHKQTSRPNRPSLTAWSSTGESFEDEAIDDAANRALLCEVGTDQAVRGLAPCTISRTALSALHTAGLPTRLFGVVLSCPGAAIKMGDSHERYRPSAESKRTVCQDV